MNILNSADTAATINLITRNARGTTTTSDGATAAGLIAKENLSHLISAGFDMPHPTSVYEGVLPFSFISNGEPLVNWSIYGNTVEGSSVGEKTDNLWNEDYSNISAVVTYKPLYVGEGTYTMSSDVEVSAGSAGTLFLLSGNVSSGASTTINGVYKNHDITATSVDGYVTIAYRTYSVDTPVGKHSMLNIGDTALPYEPYGYKIPVTCGGVTTNIYIDEPLTTGETISYNDTGVIIPTSMFLNTLSVGTTVQPEKVFIEYVK